MDATGPALQTLAPTIPISAALHQTQATLPVNVQACPQVCQRPSQAQPTNHTLICCMPSPPQDTRFEKFYLSHTNIYSEILLRQTPKQCISQEHHTE